MLTICLIVKNEGLNIEGCLTSFSEVSRDFLIVDTGSTDDTKSRAASMKARVLDFKWIEDFSAARNFALEYVETPWVMMVDADHRIGEKDAKNLRQFLEVYGNRVDVLDLKSEFSGSFSYLPRVWRTALGLRYRYPVHEHLQMIPNLRREKLDITIHDPLVRDHHSSRQRYVRIMENYVKQHPTDTRMLYYLVSDCRFLKRFKDSVKWAREYLKAEPPSDGQVARALVHMGKSLKALKQLEDAEKAFTAAMQFDSKLVDPYLLLGDLFTLKGDLLKAVNFYFKASDCTFELEGFHKSSDLYLFEPKRKLALTFVKLNEKGKAMQYAEAALKIKPADEEMKKLLNTLSQGS